MGVDYTGVVLLGWNLNDMPFEMMFEFNEEDRELLENDSYVYFHEVLPCKLEGDFEVFNVSEWWDTMGYFGVGISIRHYEYDALSYTLSDFSSKLDNAIQQMKKLLEHPKITSHGKTWLRDNPPKIYHYVYMW